MGMDPLQNFGTFCPNPFVGLEVHECILYHDFPLSTLFKDKEGWLYLEHWLNSSEETDRFLMFKTQKEFMDLYKNSSDIDVITDKIYFQKLFTKPDTAYVVDFFRRNGEFINSIEVNPSSLTENELPEGILWL